MNLGCNSSHAQRGIPPLVDVEVIGDLEGRRIIPAPGPANTGLRVQEPALLDGDDLLQVEVRRPVAEGPEIKKSPAAAHGRHVPAPDERHGVSVPQNWPCALLPSDLRFSF
ncbi:hypothetical protein DL767_004928 [Monosporascus sp. MG133]|nr:hypothetical protein DL767_004928 [Monosporascus sp. MG133]